MLEIAIVAMLAFMIAIIVLETNEKPSESVQNGHFEIPGEGSGGSYFNVTKEAELYYEASGSTSNIYVGTVEQLSGYADNESFSYNEELSRINSTDITVNGELDAGNYIIIIEKTGAYNETLKFYYEVSYDSANFFSKLYLPMILASAAISLCLFIILIYLGRIRT